jgi:hypothetical protein
VVFTHLNGNPPFWHMNIRILAIAVTRIFFVRCAGDSISYPYVQVRHVTL